MKRRSHRLLWMVLLAAVAGPGCHPRSSRSLRVGFNEFRPYVGRSASGAPEGFAVDVLRRAAARSGVDLQWFPIGKDPEASLLAGTIDVYPLLTMTAERRKALEFSDPWWHNRMVLVSRRGPGQPVSARLAFGPIAVRDLTHIRNLARRIFPRQQLSLMELDAMLPAVCGGEVRSALMDFSVLNGRLLHRPPACAGVALHELDVPEADLSLGTAWARNAPPAAEALSREISLLALEGTVGQMASGYLLFSPGHLGGVVEAIQDRRLRQMIWSLGLGLAALIGINAYHWRKTRQARRRTEKALEAAEASEQRFHAFMNNTPMVSFATDDQGRLVYVNRRWTEVFGYTTVQALGRTARELWGGEAAEQLAVADSRILSSGRPEQAMESIAGPDGRIRHWLTQKFPYRNSTGEMLLGRSAVDLTDRYEAEAALAASESRYRSLFEDAPVAIHEIDQAGRIARVNRAECRLLGFTKEQLLGSCVWEFVHPGQREASRLAVEEKLAGRRRLEPFEREYLRPDGVPVPLEIHETLIRGEDGAILGLRSCLLDLTERREAAGRLSGFARELQEKNDALEQAIRAVTEASSFKDQFLANMSHEIRTPLNGVIGMTELLLGTRLTVDQQDLASSVLQSGEHLLTILNDILDFSKIEAGKLDLERIEFDPREPVEGVLDMLAGLAARKNLELAGLVAPDVPSSIQGDPGRLRQVLANLVGNAIKFTERGEVVVRVGRAGLPDGTPALRFQVSDTGVGIHPDVQRLLFQPFRQADASTTRRFGGTGLGLAISRRLVEMMGGTIGVESRAGAGSVFEFLLPAVESSRVQPSPSPLNGQSVLVVDDNGTNRRLLRLLLESWGARVNEAETGFEALAELLSGDVPSYGLAILDYHMPGMDGIELARRIRAGSHPAPRMILLASHTDSGIREAALAAGFESCLTKPVRQSILWRALSPPAAAASPAVVPGEPESVPSAATGAETPVRVLIAEDNATNGHLVLRLVEKLGFQGHLVRNGAEAVRAIEADRYLAILMDCQMPEMDGYEATRVIRSREAGRDRVPIIALTANALKGDREKCLDAGMDDYLSKPLRLHDLGAALLRWARASSAAETVPS